MTRESIIEVIRNGVSTGSFTVDDLLVEANSLLIDSVKDALDKSGGKIVFTEDYPRMVSCCFSQVMELDIMEVGLKNCCFVLTCKDPHTKDIYELGIDDFLVGELRHVLDGIRAC